MASCKTHEDCPDEEYCIEGICYPIQYVLGERHRHMHTIQTLILVVYLLLCLLAAYNSWTFNSHVNSPSHDKDWAGWTQHLAYAIGAFQCGPGYLLISAISNRWWTAQKLLDKMPLVHMQRWEMGVTCLILILFLTALILGMSG